MRWLVEFSDGIHKQMSISRWKSDTELRGLGYAHKFLDPLPIDQPPAGHFAPADFDVNATQIQMVNDWIGTPQDLG